MIINSIGFAAHKDLKTHTPIYRMIAAERLLQFLQSKEMYFHQVTAWEDPWEMCSRFIASDKPNITIDGSRILATSCYGTCWTTEIESDAFWRIYSPDKSYVSIKTTTEKLFHSIDFATACAASVIMGFIGPIRYMDLTDEAGWSVFEDEQSRYYPSYMLPAFIKRRAFEHEHEIRFLMMNAELESGTKAIRKSNNGKGIYIPFKDVSFIEEIILDPRSDNERISIYQNLLKPYNIPVSKSQLYNTPTVVSPLRAVQFYNEPNPISICQAWLKDEFKTVDRK